MNCRKLLGIICCSILVSALAPAAQKREASKEIRSKLFKQVMADYAELRDCVASEEGGARAAEEGATVEEVDLNRDGVAEYEVQLSSRCVCGMVNCSIYIYRQGARGYESILEDAAGLGVEILKTSSNGYVDLLIEARETAATRSETTYKFDGKQYRETSATIVHQDTGEENLLRVAFNSNVVHRRRRCRVKCRLRCTTGTLSALVRVRL